MNHTYEITSKICCLLSLRKRSFLGQALLGNEKIPALLLDGFTTVSTLGCRSVDTIWGRSPPFFYVQTDGIGASDEV